MAPDKDRPVTITRRQFVAGSAAGVIPLLATGKQVGALNADSVGIEGRIVSPAGAKPDQDAGAPWYLKMRRCGQMNFNEKDPPGLDVESWAEYWASLKVDAVLVGAGGIVAFYPTNVPHHHRSDAMGSRDPLGEMSRALKKRNMRVVARMDCNYGYEEALADHPEWFQHKADGTPVRHNECPWLVRACMFGPRFTDYMTAIYREINAAYPVDGFFTNGWPSTGTLEVCHCVNCNALYKKLGGAPPESTDATDPIYRAYYKAYMARIAEVWSLWQSVAREKSPEAVYVGNLGGGIRAVKNVKQLSEVAAWFNADHQGRGGDTPVWDCAQQGRVGYSVMKGRTVTDVIGAYSNGRPLWRHSAKPASETTIWMAQTTASGMVPWFHWLGASPADNRWRKTGRSFYSWLAENEPHFRNERSVADVAVLYPQNTIAFYRSGSGSGAWRGEERIQTTDYMQGLYYALLEGRLLFDFVHEDDLASLTPHRHRALLIPNAAYLSDDQCQQIRRYVAAGGSLVATFETSLYNEWGDKRTGLALADVFGAEMAGDVVGPISNSYAHIERKHPIVAGFEGTTMLPGAETRLPIRSKDQASPILTVIPAYPMFPPEMVFPRTPRTKDPAVIARETGRSRIVYFPGDVDRTYWRSGNPDFGRLLLNAVHWVMADQKPKVSIEGDGMIETFGWETEPGYALHILNYTNPNMTRGPFRAFYPIGPLRVGFEVPAGRTVANVRALRTGRPLRFTQAGKSVQFEIPSVADYEVIVLV